MAFHFGELHDGRAADCDCGKKCGAEDPVELRRSILEEIGERKILKVNRRHPSSSGELVDLPIRLYDARKEYGNHDLNKDMLTCRERSEDSDGRATHRRKKARYSSSVEVDLMAAGLDRGEDYIARSPPTMIRPVIYISRSPPPDLKSYDHEDEKAVEIEGIDIDMHGDDEGQPTTRRYEEESVRDRADDCGSES